jgi:hypothetical protein
MSANPAEQTGYSDVLVSEFGALSSDRVFKVLGSYVHTRSLIYRETVGRNGTYQRVHRLLFQEFAIICADIS